MKTKIGTALTAFLLSTSSLALAVQEQPPSIGGEERDAFAKILEFLNTIAQWLGQLIVQLIHSIVPSVSIPGSIVDAMGILALVTIFLVVTDLAKRLSWLIVGAGWVLIAVRIIMVVTQSSGNGS